MKLIALHTNLTTFGVKLATEGRLMLYAVKLTATATGITAYEQVLGT